MPTNRPRQVLTETDRLARALDEAVRDRRDVLARTGGSLNGLYGEGYLGDLRGDWPE
jgi:hypothetical protein